MWIVRANAGLVSFCLCVCAAGSRGCCLMGECTMWTTTPKPQPGRDHCHRGMPVTFFCVLCLYVVWHTLGLDKVRLIDILGQRWALKKNLSDVTPFPENKHAHNEGLQTDLWFKMGWTVYYSSMWNSFISFPFFPISEYFFEKRKSFSNFSKKKCFPVYIIENHIQTSYGFSF